MEICRIAGERLAGADPRQLIAVGLDLGDDSGLEPENLRFCLETLLAQPPFAIGHGLVDDVGHPQVALHGRGQR